jgi:cyclic lactone autoinducer peptide
MEIIMKKLVSKISMKMKKKNWTVIAMNALALLAVVQNVNATCAWLDHQPEVPVEAQQFKKI